MNRTDMIDHYVLIRMWCPNPKTEALKEPHYVQRLSSGNGEVQWTVTQVFEEAMFFKSENIAKRIVKAVGRLQHRIERGWLYEVVKVTEEVLEHNLPPPSTAEAEVEEGSAAE